MNALHASRTANRATHAWYNDEIHTTSGDSAFRHQVKHNMRKTPASEKVGAAAVLAASTRHPAITRRNMTP